MKTLQNHDPKGSKSLKRDVIEQKTPELLLEIYEYCKRLYAEKKQSLLIVLQGMDGSGKDGLTRMLFQEVSPTWVNVSSFKKPTPEEFAHDFLWRIHQKTPEYGTISVFNRSHYEDILVPSVYGYIDHAIIEKRYEQINQFEKYLEANGTRVVKFYLNISYEKQETKLLERINTAEKHWKHSDTDWDTRARWKDFMAVYEQLIKRCNAIPWHIIPCDSNTVKVYSAAKILVKVLKEMNPQFPPLVSQRFTADYSKSKLRY